MQLPRVFATTHYLASYRDMNDCLRPLKINFVPILKIKFDFWEVAQDIDPHSESNDTLSGS